MIEHILLHIDTVSWYVGLEYLTMIIESVLQGGDAVWCIGFQKIQGQGITILGGIGSNQYILVFFSCNSWINI